MTAIEKDQVLALPESLDYEKRTAAVRFMEFLLLHPVAHAAAMARPTTSR